MEPPSWIDEKFLVFALKETCEGIIDNIKFVVKPAVPPGNNYLSLAFRVDVKYQVKKSGIKSTSLIVKAPANNQFGQKISENFDFYSKEPQVYEKLLALMEKKVLENFSPKFYPCLVKGGLILQDLKEEGYIMCNRLQQLDFAHCKEVFTTIAKFHAASVACHKVHPNLVETLGKEMFFVGEGSIVDELKNGIHNSLRNVIDLAETLKVFKKFTDLVKNKSLDQLWESTGKLVSPRPLKINVLNHGDLWTPNILFKYNEEGTVERVKFVDYQLTRYGSPAFDLAYFIWTSGTDEVREHRQADLYKIYVKTLNKTLTELECEDRYSMEDLLEDLEESADFVLLLICHFLPLFLADPEDGVVTVEELNSKDRESTRNLANGKYFKRLLPIAAKQYSTFYA